MFGIWKLIGQLNLKCHYHSKVLLQRTSLKKSFRTVGIFSMNPAIQWISIRDIKCTFQGRANLSSARRYPPVEHLGLVLQRNSAKKLSF